MSVQTRIRVPEFASIADNLPLLPLCCNGAKLQLMREPEAIWKGLSRLMQMMPGAAWALSRDWSSHALSAHASQLRHGMDL